MIKREENLLFIPCGYDFNHKCKECKECFITIFSTVGHCNLCDVVDIEGPACANCFKERTK